MTRLYVRRNLREKAQKEIEEEIRRIKKRIAQKEQHRKDLLALVYLDGDVIDRLESTLKAFEHALQEVGPAE
jgi:hypothetical protein